MKTSPTIFTYNELQTAVNALEPVCVRNYALRALSRTKFRESFCLEFCTQEDFETAMGQNDVPYSAPREQLNFFDDETVDVVLESVRDEIFSIIMRGRQETKAIPENEKMAELRTRGLYEAVGNET